MIRILATAVLALFIGPTRVRADPVLRVVSGVDATGHASRLWLAVLEKRLPPADYRSIAPIVKPIGVEDTAWTALIEARLPDWKQALPELMALFAPAAPPATIVIVLGNRGSEDAFTHDGGTIGFDLSALERVYGPAGLEGHDSLMDRLFRHELMHIMQKAWLRAHPWAEKRPLDRALLDIWKEGLGNHQSLSDKWIGADGRRTALAASALAELEPRFVARIAALGCASPDTQGTLLTNLSSGPFARKWGAVPVALWLAEDTAATPDALRRFIEAGPAGVWDLASRHLPEPLKAAFEEARQASLLCP
jgi:hypothetical protein